MDFANGIVKRINSLYPDLSILDIKLIATKCTLYFEDVIADAGIWRSFTEEMRRRYGRPLPFYDVDEENYFNDEPNLEDVRLLVWLARINSKLGYVANPENEALMHIADIIFEYMDSMFEKMPVNDALHDFFHDAAFMSDYYAARDVLKWAYMSSYLSSSTNALQAFADNYNELVNRMREDQLFYHVESTVIFETKIGPLGLLPSEWVSMILESNGKTDDAKIVREMVGKTDVYHVTSRGDNLFGMCTIKRTDGETLELSKKNFDELTKPAVGDYFLGTIVKFKDDYFQSGVSSWDSHFKEYFDDLTKKHKAMERKGIPNYDKLVKKNGGSQLFYFKTYKDVEKFLKKEVGVKEDGFGLEHMFDDVKKNWVVFFPGSTEAMIFFPEAAQLICDPRNPYYNESEAKADNLTFPVTATDSLVTYLMERGYLPHAGFVHVKGNEAGEKLFRENYDFVVRCLNH